MLASAAALLQREGQQQWLIEHILRDLTGASAGTIARGLILAGFLDQSARAERLWAVELAQPPASGWLADVHSVASKRYQRQKFADAQCERFKTSSAEADAFIAFELMAAVTDDRIYLGARRPYQKELQSWSWRRRTHWHFGWPAVKASGKAMADSRKKLFLGDRPPSSGQPPRLRS